MKSLTIGQKIAGGFTALILISAILGGVATYSMRKVRAEAHQMSTEFVPEVHLASAFKDSVSHTQLAVRSYGLTADARYFQQVVKGIEAIDRDFAALNKLAVEHPHLVKLRSLLGEISTATKEYKDLVLETEKKNGVITRDRDELNTASANFITNIDKLIHAQNDRLAGEIKEFATVEKLLERQKKLKLASEVRGEGNAARIAVFKAQALRDPKLIQEGLALFESMDKHFAELDPLLKVPADRQELEQVRTAARTYREKMTEVMHNLQALEEIGRKRAAAGEHLESLANGTADAGMQQTIASADSASVELSRSSWIVQTMLIVAIAVGATVAGFIIRGITRVLRATTDSLSAGALQIVAAAGQVSSSSQSLAEGASEQAASLEETSASIEEMSSMTKRNSQHAVQARDVAKAARQSADQSAVSVNRLNTAMSALQSSSAEVAKIVKTIDEIAFQTNILALNAAVEAARAGEAGAGFAVVAEEVRSLAQRSAQAAKETAEKIETSLTKSQEGGRMSQEVSVGLNGIIEHVRQLDSLITEIAQASSEQSQGIEQINTSVSQMDQTTQSTAAAAEESASAAEEMNAQASELNGLVRELLKLVGTAGHSAQVADQEAPPPARKTRIDPRIVKASTRAPVKSAKSSAEVVVAPSHAPGPEDAFFR